MSAASELPRDENITPSDESDEEEGERRLTPEELSAAVDALARQIDAHMAKLRRMRPDHP
ncbi:hypothetical protein [Streptomyces sp. RFCAC02]|uniref:hypothetical protein n=1 Tax=Streptomyces sp. RFCAC02 TaxID=2499143 RepID=UPI00102207CA|nr:hypothetical protein [Streptomyces sp. RFCAC02]